MIPVMERRLRTMTKRLGMMKALIGDSVRSPWAPGTVPNKILRRRIRSSMATTTTSPPVKMMMSTANFQRKKKWSARTDGIALSARMPLTVWWRRKRKTDLGPSRVTAISPPILTRRMMKGRTKNDVLKANLKTNIGTAISRTTVMTTRDSRTAGSSLTLREKTMRRRRRRGGTACFRPWTQFLPTSRSWQRTRMRLEEK
mmetsp:Transcript_16688/g.26472  ORF Transcript_16688/g.26472 Transcript_16688/m.26472 type:complete len:200 (+) Transcript_16688:4352-4951(+)